MKTKICQIGKHEALNQAAENYYELNKYNYNLDSAQSFKDGAIWQKEQDKAIIEELSESLIHAYSFMVTNKEYHGRNILETIKQSILKTENYLKQ